MKQVNGNTFAEAETAEIRFFFFFFKVMLDYTLISFTVKENRIRQESGKPAHRGAINNAEILSIMI